MNPSYLIRTFPISALGDFSLFYPVFSCIQNRQKINLAPLETVSIILFY